MDADRVRHIFRFVVTLTAIFGTTARIILSFTIGFGFPIFLYFTIQSNIMVCIFLVINLVKSTKESSISSLLHGGILLYILITGIIFNIVLAPGIKTSGFNLVVVSINHTVTPILFLTEWLFTESHGRLKWRHLRIWLIYPALYLFASSVEGTVTDVFRYPFLDFLNQKPAAYFTGLAIIIAAFIAVSAVIVLTDKKLKAAGSA